MQELHLKLEKMEEANEEIPNEVFEEYERLRATGFFNWISAEYHRFVKAFRRYAVDDFDSIAAEVQTKTADDIQAYMAVFLARYRETKERDLVVRKFAAKDFDQRNLETLLDFDQYRDYALFLQENFYMSRASYLALFEAEHKRLLE